jgi:hypothetical protein
MEGQIAHWSAWPEVKWAIEHALYYLVVISVLGCLLKSRVIRDIIREFNSARGPIWDLRKTITDLKDLEPVIRQLGEQIGLLDAKVDAARKQVAELQVESISSRTQDETINRPAQPDGELTAGAGRLAVEDAENNWEMLRQYWRRNTRRIEYVIEQIRDGRTRLAYDRIPRTRYGRIVHKLQEAGLITEAAANASIELLKLFNSYRPKNRPVPNSITGTLQLLDQMLDKELVDFKKVVAADADEGPDDDLSATSMPPPVPSQDVQRTDGRLPSADSEERPVS